MSLTVLILLTIVAAVVVAALILGEIFFLPGFGLPGILGGLGLVGISGYLFLSGYGTLGMIFIVIVAVLFALGFWLLSKRDLKGFALSEKVEEKVNTLPPSLNRGDRGIARSRLTLGGNAEIEGEIFYVESEEGFIMEGTPIYVSRIENNKVFVRVIKDDLMYGPKGDQPSPAV
ncbi:MAG: NfeD family protein [Porphyromonas sp.]|nr:NfeD family protein [Bacteroidales bacterium]MDY3099901.1 NfeD family protein [Porphyromonas sp.]